MGIGSKDCPLTGLVSHIALDLKGQSLRLLPHSHPLKQQVCSLGRDCKCFWSSCFDNQLFPSRFHKCPQILIPFLCHKRANLRRFSGGGGRELRCHHMESSINTPFERLVLELIVVCSFSSWFKAFQSLLTSSLPLGLIVSLLKKLKEFCYPPKDQQGLGILNLSFEFSKPHFDVGYF